MTYKLPQKTLHLVIMNHWLVESINDLGSGNLIHLVYQNDRIAPEVLADIKDEDFGEGLLVEIISQELQTGHRVAVAEIFKCHDFKSFFRFDLRLLEVGVFVRDGIVKLASDYLCYYHYNPV